ncbi:MAG: IS1380 family transposase, partial [Arhodomonas sp.]|nr:IS1380 family transposase [Arhodomonas sp.]
MEPARFTIRQTQQLITGQAGLVLAGQALSRFAQLPQQLDPAFPVRGTALPTSDVVKGYVGLLCQAKSDFEAIEAYRGDAFFTQALGLRGVPSAARLRQRLDELAATEGALEALDAVGERLLARAKAPITATAEGYVPLDIDVFVMDNSETAKEGVSRTYAGVDGYAPIGAYLGEEGWCVGLELRAGRAHSAHEADYALERTLARAARLTEAAVLVRMDSGFDAGKLFAAIDAASQARQADGGAPIEALVKWNPRSGGAEAVIEAALADEALEWTTPREGKRVAVFEDTLERRGGEGEGFTLRRVLRVTERTIDRHGQHLLVPAYEVHGYLTTLGAEAADAERVIALYAEHGTHEQFHSEIKTDLDLERLPSGKFATNDLVCSLAALAYNVLRLIGQNALTGEDALLRHPAKRRRLRTVIQELMS